MSKDEHLCRGKRIDNGEWVTGNYCEIPPPLQAFGEPPSSKIYIFTENPHTISDWGMPRNMCLIDVDPDTVGRCTGLRDKMGRYAYEGDIIKSHYINAKKAYHIEYIIFDKGKFMSEIKISETGFVRALLADGIRCLDKAAYMDEFEIIGNVHDNPELLKVGETE